MSEQSTSHPQTGMDKFFDTLRGIGIRRRTDDKWIAGVCSGLADRLGVDPVIVRAGLVLLSLLWGVGITIYLVAWALLPNDRDEIVAQRAFRDGDGGAIVLVVVAALALFGGSAFDGPWWGGHAGWGFPWGVALTGLLIYWLVKRSGNPDADQRVRTQQLGTPYPGGPSPTASSPTGSSPAGSSPTGMSPTGPSPTGPSPAGPSPAGPSVTDLSFTGSSPTGPLSPGASAAGPSTTGVTQVIPQGPGAHPGRPAPAGQGIPPNRPSPGHFGPPSPAVPKRPRRRSGGPLMALLALGLALATYGSLIWASSAFTWPGDHPTIAIAGSLGAIGLLLVVLGIAGWRAGFVAFLAVVLAVTAWTAAVVPSGIQLGGRVGDVTWAPTSAVSGANYHLGAGDGVLDLTGLPTASLPAGTLPPTIPAYVGLGELKVLVPAGLSVKVVGHVGLGEIDAPTDVPNNGQGGSDLTRTIVTGDGPTEVLVNAGVGIGQLTVVKE